MQGNDTIAAISTPPGRGGIGVVRISGPSALAVVRPLLRVQYPLLPGRVRRAQILDPASGAVLDEALVTWFASPHSYTTEDVVEISCHGAPVLLAAVLAACLAQGARLAEPGEFTRRAFLAGRLDLTEAEAVHDLISATTLGQARTAAAQLGGSVSRAVRPARELLLLLIAELEAGIDFAEDDLDLLSASELGIRLRAITGTLQELTDSYRFGRVLHNGLTIAVAGRPNAGKSSLFNRLLGHTRAIVTAQPGTTRDPLLELLDLDGIPVRLADTAGLRQVPHDAASEPERLGIERTRELVAEAEAVLLVQEASSHPGSEPDTLLTELERECEAAAGRPVLRVLTKADLLDAESRARAEALPGALLTSAVTGEGLEAVRTALLRTLTGSASSGAEGAVITSLRQHTALTDALGGAEAAQAAAAQGLPHELLLLDLYSALESLDQLTGATERDEVLNRIFSTFCIGK